MDKSSITLPIYYISQIQDQLEEAGHDASDWLAKYKLTEDRVRDLSEFVNLDMFEGLILDAMAISSDPALGLKVGRRLGVTTHGMLGYALMATSSLREALDIFDRFLNTRTPLLEVQTHNEGDELILELIERFPLGDIRIPFTEAVMLTLNNVLAQITLGQAPITKVGFPYPAPEYAALYKEMFRCEVEFGCERARSHFMQTSLDLPLQMADKKSLQQAEALCEQELKKLQIVDTMEFKIRKYLLSHQGEFPSLNEIAGQFHMSARTLHRHLQHEQTSYKKILEDVRRTLSIEYLKNTNLSIAEISYALGYTDIANFRRAFKRWEGVAPSEYRTA